MIIGLVGPVMARWLASMGLSLVVMTGLVASVSSLRSSLLSGVGGLPSDAVGLAGLFGVWECLGMVLGAATFCVTWASTSGIWRLGKS
jgi:Protein of unknown function (DUF2523)